MNKVSITILASALLLAACSGSGPIDPKYVDMGTPEDPRVCKTITPIGTRIGERICMRQSQWDAQSENASEAVRGIQDRSAASGQAVAQD